MKKNNPVFQISLALCVVIAVWAVAFNESFAVISDTIFSFLTVNFGWLYLIAMLFFVVFVIFIAFSKFGQIRLGAEDSRPEYSTISWFAMLFGAGMGVGLVFWGIHPWANYAIIGLALAYFQFRKNKPGLISSVLEPLLGEKGVKGPIGKLVDILAVFATVAGVVTSLGLGVLQINSGLNYLFGIPTTLWIQIIIIAVISVIYIWSAVSGVDKGIKLISDANLYIAFALMAFVMGVVIAPSLGSLVWFAIFGTLGIHLGVNGTLSTETLAAVAATPERGLFVVMQEYPFGMGLSIVALVLLCTFFITSANSGTFVLSMLSSDGALNPPNSKKVLWGVIQSIMAVGLLIAGGLKPLQAISIAAAFPFIFKLHTTCIVVRHLL